MKVGQGWPAANAPVGFRSWLQVYGRDQGQGGLPHFYASLDGTGVLSAARSLASVFRRSPFSLLSRWIDVRQSAPTRSSSDSAISAASMLSQIWCRPRIITA